MNITAEDYKKLKKVKSTTTTGSTYMKPTLREKLENIKFNCPTCPLPHNLSGIETDKILSLISQRMMKAIPKEKDFTDKFYGKTEVDAGFEQAYNQALSEVREIFKELLR